MKEKYKDSVASRLGFKSCRNPLSGAEEVCLAMTNEAMSTLSLHPDGQVSLETRSAGLHHSLEFDSSQVQAVNGGVEITGSNSKIETRLHVDPNGRVEVNIKPR